MNFERQIPWEFTSYAVPDGNCRSIILKKKKKRIFLNNLTGTLSVRGISMQSKSRKINFLRKKKKL